MIYNLVSLSKRKRENWLRSRVWLVFRKLALNDTKPSVVKRERSNHVKASLHTSNSVLEHRTWRSKSSVTHSQDKMSRTRLQCFSAELYTSLEELEGDSQRCIAPTKDKTRCAWTIDDTALAEAAQKWHNAQQCQDRESQTTLIREFVMLHCCEQQHRHKLQADETGCLDKIVLSYRQSPSVVQAIDRRIKSATEPLLHEEAVTTFVTKPKDGAERNILSTTTTISTRLGSRSLANSDTIKKRHKSDLAVFRPYKSDPKDSVREDLLQNVPIRSAVKGEIYSFTWPSHPEFVKIGFTSRSAEHRIAIWRRCHPGAKLIMATCVNYPERIERLVHLQLAQKRHRICICEVCYKSHEEWFKESAEEVSRVISDWAELMSRDPLYHADRTLKPRWRKMLREIEGEITARTLLDRLNVDEILRKKDDSHQLLTKQAEILQVPHSLGLPAADLAVGAMATAMYASQQHDLIMLYFDEFMHLIARIYDCDAISARPLFKESADHPAPEEHSPAPMILAVQLLGRQYEYI